MKNENLMYVDILEKELIPAMGCTEPIAIAYAGAKVRDVLGQMPEKIIVKCSGNIIKNVKGVVVPSTKNMRGIEVSAIIGVLSNNANCGLEVLKNISEECVQEMCELKKRGYCRVELVENVENLYIDIIAFNGNDSAEVIIANTHTNIEKILKNNEVIYDGKAESDRDCAEFDMSLETIYDFAKNGDIRRLKPLLDIQIKYNCEIAVEGINSPYGANVGKTILK